MMESVLVEQELAPVGRRDVERLRHDDGVGRAHLHAQLAELTGIELEGERLGVVALLGLEHLHLDDLRRTDVLAEAAADARLLAGVRLVDEGQHAAEAIGIGAGRVRVHDGDRLAEEVAQGHGHGAAHGQRDLADLAPEARASPVTLHGRLPAPPPAPRPAVTARWPATGASRRWPGSGPRGCARSSSGPTSPPGTRARP